MPSVDVEVVTAAPPSPNADHHWVRMRDGVLLSTDVYLPSELPAPVILVREPYDKASDYTFFPKAAQHFQARGYALVVQDVRGKFSSGGRTFPVVTEAADGWDTLEWIAQQSWSDGRAGMFGDSYYGLTQWAAVASGHPSLRAIVPRVTSPDFVEQIGTPSGESAEPVWLEGMDYLAHHWVDNNAYGFRTDWTTRPLAEAFEAGFEAIGGRAEIVDAFLGRSPRPELWPNGHPFQGRPIPVLQTVGWFDNMAVWAMRDYVHLRSRDDWGPLVYLYADSVDHENFRFDELPITPDKDHNRDPKALERLIPRYLGPALDFFDAFVAAKGEQDIPRVRWHLANAGHRVADVWPPEGSRALDLFLTRTGRELALSHESPAEVEPHSWVYDPSDLNPSATPDGFAFLAFYPDEQAKGQRRDVVSFVAAVASAHVDLVGPVSVTVDLTSDGPSVDVFARLLDRDPDGSEHLIVRGQSHRPSGVGDPVEIDLGHTGYRLLPGHRLVLRLSNSDFPAYLPHPGTDVDPWLATHVHPNLLTLELSGSSRLRLTVLD